MKSIFSIFRLGALILALVPPAGLLFFLSILSLPGEAESCWELFAIALCGFYLLSLAFLTWKNAATRAFALRPHVELREALYTIVVVGCTGGLMSVIGVVAGIGRTLGGGKRFDDLLASSIPFAVVGVLGLFVVVRVRQRRKDKAEQNGETQ
jgi:hypothetical protein